MKRVGDVCQLWLQVLVVEEVLGACYIENIRGKLIQRMLESLLGYFKEAATSWLRYSMASLKSFW